MNYPVWVMPGVGGGFLIALIAVLHVYVSHLAVGGGLFLWLTDRRAYRENDVDLLGYVRSHIWFFLLLTMVFGGLTGVGIWFIIALVSPAATSTLIHNFVFGWAIEWVFFVGEIVSLLVYHYRFDSLAPRTRLTISFLYFLFAWLSLVIINGIIDFMLTPGGWLRDHAFWSGFFNPTYWPALCFRTFGATMLGGLFGCVTAVFLKDAAFRRRMLRWCSRWLLFSFVGIVPSAFWYVHAVPAATRSIAFGLNPETGLHARLLLLCSAAIFLIGLAMMLRSRLGVQRLLTAVLVVVGLFWIGNFEYVREIARKPWVIHGYMYSNSILKEDVPRLDADGVLAHARWTQVRVIDDTTRPGAGWELFNLECLACHTIGGYNDIVARLGDFTEEGLRSLLSGQGRLSAYMPPFVGTEAEKDALALYLTGLQTARRHAEGLPPLETGVPPEPPVKPAVETPAPFDAKTDGYVLLAWNDLGMHCITDNDRWFGLLPPANTLQAVLIRRGETPELVTDGVEIAYAVEEGYDRPQDHVDFWQHAKQVWGADLEPGVGLKGNRVDGTMSWDDGRSSYVAEMIPVVPYRDTAAGVVFNPYPVFTLEARDADGRTLAATKVVAPAATEFGCRDCHGGKAEFQGQAGLSEVTAKHILRVHDYLSGTDLLPRAENGEPRLCQSCHADPAVGAAGDPLRLSLSAAIHGWHANYMGGMGADACETCHPASPARDTRCFRGLHARTGLSCVDCHGTLQEHALALLAGEGDKPAARRLAAHLVTREGIAPEGIEPRTPWLQEPDCLTCHVDFEAPGPHPSAYNVWNAKPDGLYRFRTGNGMIPCEACHGSTHALYPAVNPYSPERDALQPLQYAGNTLPIGADRDCAVCHTVPMTDPIHHENMDHMFRRRDLIGKP